MVLKIIGVCVLLTALWVDSPIKQSVASVKTNMYSVFFTLQHIYLNLVAVNEACVQNIYISLAFYIHTLLHSLKYNFFKKAFFSQ